MLTAYLSGLGTSTSKEAKEYFADMERHRIMFKYNGTEDDAAITLVSLFFGAVHNVGSCLYCVWCNITFIKIIIFIIHITLTY